LDLRAIISLNNGIRKKVGDYFTALAMKWPMQSVQGWRDETEKAISFKNNSFSG